MRVNIIVRMNVIVCVGVIMRVVVIVMMIIVAVVVMIMRMRMSGARQALVQHPAADGDNGQPGDCA